MVSPTRTADPPPPTQAGTVDGLAYTLWLPADTASPPRAGVVIVHGADSAKESHQDYARTAAAGGLAAICFDQRGHGASEGALDGRAIQDVVTIADRLRAELLNAGPIALRGSSMGGYLAIVAAAPAGAGAVVAICPASAARLAEGLQVGRYEFAADRESLRALLDAHHLTAAVAALDVPLLLLHAQGDERVPVEHSRELAAAAAHPESRLVEVPGGHHRSVQHDPELQALSRRFIERSLGV